MNEDFLIFQKFTDLSNANEFARELEKNGIEYLIQNNNKSSVGNFEINTIDFDVAVNIRSEDFPKADKVLDEFYKSEIKNIDKNYYLFEFSNDELHEIITKPFEWGRFDYQLAKKILEDQGEEISDLKVQKIKQDTITELSKVEQVSKQKIIIGYILSFLFPLVGILIGYNIINNKKILPNGQIFNLHSPKDRTHGKQILTISLMWLFILLFIRILFLLKEN